jgi:hypothetical protein
MEFSESVLRVHPAIGIARVGNSEEYCISPESLAGLEGAGLEGAGLGGGGGEAGEATVGGLPIRPGTEAETITSGELRDRDGALKRQAARFRIYRYPKGARRNKSSRMVVTVPQRWDAMDGYPSRIGP